MLDELPTQFPNLYGYLTKHKIRFDQRKSSIYKNRPAFSIFGVGDYTHLKYKVAIGSLYTKPVFQLLEPAPRPAVLDDTGYMIATDDYAEAMYLFAVLNLDCTKQFLMSVSHASDKRRFSRKSSLDFSFHTCTNVRRRFALLSKTHGLLTGISLPTSSGRYRIGVRVASRTRDLTVPKDAVLAADTLTA
jgi:hypothetical protein